VCVNFFWADDAPPEIKKQRSISIYKVGDGPDEFESAYDAGLAVLDYCQKCWYNSSLDWAKIIVPYLEEHQTRDELGKWTAERERLVKQLAEVDKRIAYLIPESEEE
jgi:hypothetical protein